MAEAWARGFSTIESRFTFAGRVAAKTITSALTGVFREDPKTRDEFLRLAHNGRS